MSAPASLAAWAPASALPAFWRPSVSMTMRLAWPGVTVASASWIAWKIFVPRPRPLIAGHRGDTEPPARLSAPVEHALQRQQRRGDEDEQGPELALDRHGR